MLGAVETQSRKRKLSKQASTALSSSRSLLNPVSALTLEVRQPVLVWYVSVRKVCVLKEAKSVLMLEIIKHCMQMCNHLI